MISELMSIVLKCCFEIHSLTLTWPVIRTNWSACVSSASEAHEESDEGNVCKRVFVLSVMALTSCFVLRCIVCNFAHLAENLLSGLPLKVLVTLPMYSMAVHLLDCIGVFTGFLSLYFHYAKAKS